MKLCDSEESIIQNLRAAGCDEKTIIAFLRCMRDGKEPESFRLLKKQRSLLLEAVHREEKKIDCLDYLVYQMQKAKN
ncbi:MAG: hypothetical protein HFG20_10470 [Anaerotruncus sp.]|nr:hypothetical protein [Anaerotruncus sp.]